MRGILLVGFALVLVACGGSSSGGGGGSGDDSGSSGNGDSPPESESVAITLDADPPAGGEVTGGGTFDPEDTVSIEAQPVEFYEFAGWFDGEEAVSSSSTHEFEAETDLTLTARFAQLETAAPVNLPDEGDLALFAADHARAGLAFVVTEEETVGDGQQGIWRTDNGGQNWEKVADDPVDFVEIGFGDPGYIVAGHDEYHLISSDRGKTWSRGQINSSVVLQGGTAVGEDIYLASSGVMASGLYRSQDGGDFWTRLFADTDVEDNQDARLDFVRISPDDPDTIYVGPMFGSNIQKTVDGGESWMSVQEGLSTDDFLLAEGMRLDVENADRLFVRNNLSVNGGANWSQREGLSPARTAWLDGKLVTIEDQSVRVSDDYGDTWRDVMPLTDDAGLSFGQPDRIYVSEESLYFHGGNIEPLYRMDLADIREHMD